MELVADYDQDKLRKAIEEFNSLYQNQKKLRIEQNYFVDFEKYPNFNYLEK